MNSDLELLYKIAQKPSRTVIGLMSGTSLDGLDVALCTISGSGKNTEVQLVKFDNVDYSEDIKLEIRNVFAKQTIDFQKLVLLNEWIGVLHAKIILDCLKRWEMPADKVDLVASHGQTVFHAPKIRHQQKKFPNVTLQIGDGDHIAVKTGIITLSDFRQKHLAAGGEGAPLAVYGDYFLFGKKGNNRIMLNMGGIANFTYLPSSCNPEEIFVTDTGTGNTLIDAFTRLHYPTKSYDKDAEIAKTGTVNSSLLKALKANEFFLKPFPKTTGPELFNIDYVTKAQTQSKTANLPIPDLLATLTRFSAESIAEAIRSTIDNSGDSAENFTIYRSGGGTHNPLLKNGLKELLPCHFSTTDYLGISGDTKEAILFAILSNETVCGGDSDFGVRKGIPSVSMEKISFPS